MLTRRMFIERSLSTGIVLGAGSSRFDDGAWKEGWYFGDELGLLLQLGVPNALV